MVISVIGWSLAGCDASEQGAPDSPGHLEDERLGSSGIDELRWSAADRTVRVLLAQPPETGRRRRGATGSVEPIQAVEYALGRLPRVVPVRADGSVTPALARPLGYESVAWQMRLLPADGEQAVRLELCRGDWFCEVHAGGDVASAMVSVGEALVPDLGGDVPPAPEAAVRPWLAGRAAFDRRRWAAAIEAFEQAAALDPAGSGGADRAATLAAAGHERAAGDAWGEVVAAAPRDPRFVLPSAIAWARAGDLERALAALDGLPVGARQRGQVLQARVEVALASGPADEGVLREWASVDSAALEPIRRQLELVLERGDLARALELAGDLEARGAAQEAGQLRLALTHESGRLDRAARLARELGLPDDAARIEARARASGLSDDPHPLARVAVGRTALAEGRADEALRRADGVLVRRPWSPEALSLRVDALVALDRPEAADEARSRLRWVDP